MEITKKLRKTQGNSDVRPLSRYESWSLWSKAWFVAIFWLIRKICLENQKGFKEFTNIRI
uniref:Uncharacterized protein n=2 Tax=Archaea TaxID=2157 RepID=D6PBB7_9ARCH|nr:hypothetical protein [uncultured archaeon MedDCM-OCT-S04-C246]ANV78847.1 hypothetical protein [uncultured Candidatus Thalassoarchaea sp.]